MAIKCFYTDLDGTLLGRGGGLLKDAAGRFTLMPVRALEACARAGAEVVPMSGRRRPTVAEIARLLGQTAFVYEVGCGLSVDGEDTLLTGNLQPREGMTVYELIAQSGAPRLLLDRYGGRLEYHSPWHVEREFTHLMRGFVNVAEADSLLTEHGHGDLRLVDNGAIAPKPSLPDLDTPHAYHLMPRTASKAAGVEAHMRTRGYAEGECVAVGDSREDLGVAGAVGRFFLVRNAVERDPSISEGTAANVEVTEERNGEGFYEAVVRSLAEAPGG
jgi:hydroxymethylpyrimidine pyrophosphatase-like HAD family hydrolase